MAFLAAGITAVATWSSIRGIKKKINQLQEQNIIQEKKIGVLGKFLNLTMERVRVHDEKLYKIEVQLVQFAGWYNTAGHHTVIYGGNE